MGGIDKWVVYNRWCDINGLCDLVDIYGYDSWVVLINGLYITGGVI